MITAESRACKVDVPPWVENPYRLVSLGEIVEPFLAGVFIELSRTLERLANLPPDATESELSDLERSNARAMWEFAEKDCVALGLTTSAITVGDIRRLLDTPNTTQGAYRKLIVDFQGRLRDEMRAFRFFSISTSEAEHYNHWWYGWEEVLNRFPDAVRDVEEASKCFALARYAAAVFHSMQVIESGLIELGKFMQIPDPQSGFTAVSNELKRVLNKKYPELTQFEKDNRPFFEQINATVEALKTAWRNKISHVQGKLVLMTADFTPEIAEEIRFASRAFMRRLATDLPVMTEE